MCPVCKQKYGTNATCTACQKHKAYEESLARSNWNKDSVQFPRLLAEINAAGLTDEQYDTLEESMDLDRAQIDELFDRAEGVFEKEKDGLIAHEGNCPVPPPDDYERSADILRLLNGDPR
jgi:hypothetical protein